MVSMIVVSLSQICQETAIVGGGCFWGIQAALQKLRGVCNAEAGYSGGQEVNPQYADIKAQKTGHAEVVKVTYDKDIISFKDLLLAFMRIHDPTSLNKQDIDEGTSYRSIIFYQNDNQLKTIHQVFQILQPTLENSIVTEVKKLTEFYPAEDYHQNYFQCHPESQCANTMPSKLQALKGLLKN